MLQSQRNRLSPYALEHVWVDKDPRLCITYSAYLHILLRRIPLVFILREPLAVASSLYIRNGFSLNRGLVLWWMYNHHIASHLCPTDLFVTYKSLLSLNDQSLQQLVGPFLEIHRHRRPSQSQARDLISSFLKPEFNRAEDVLNAESRSYINPLLLEICQHSYRSITQSTDQLSNFKEHFNFLPRAVLEHSVRDHLFPETKYLLLQERFNLLESEVHSIGCSLQKREHDCALLRNEIRDIRNSHSWKITSPLRVLANFFRSVST